MGNPCLFCCFHFEGGRVRRGALVLKSGAREWKKLLIIIKKMEVPLESSELLIIIKKKKVNNLLIELKAEICSRLK